MLSRVRELAGMRETHKDYVVLVLAHVREQLAIVGAELTDAGLLDGTQPEVLACARQLAGGQLTAPRLRPGR
jgi:hypothetical protein